jgi:hypothetical protein
MKHGADFAHASAHVIFTDDSLRRTESEKYAVLAIWADHVMAAVEGRASNVVPLRA